MRNKRARCPLLLALSLAIGAQGGCASSSLDLAPKTPSTPFKSVGDATASITASGARDFGLAPAVGLPVPDPAVDLEAHYVYNLAELIDIALTTNQETRSSWELARQAPYSSFRATVGFARAADGTIPYFLTPVTYQVLETLAAFENEAEDPEAECEDEGAQCEDEGHESDTEPSLGSLSHFDQNPLVESASDRTLWRCRSVSRLSAIATHILDNGDLLACVR